MKRLIDLNGKWNLYMAPHSQVKGTNVEFIDVINTKKLPKNIDFINIGIYFIAIVIMLYKKSHLLKTEKFSNSIFMAISVFVIILIGLLFAIWSYNPPALGIFKLPEIC